MLYKVTWMQAYEYDNQNFVLKERYTVAESYEEAEVLVKKDIPKSYLTKDFEVIPVEEKGERELYEVSYEEFYDNFTKLRVKTILVTGCTEEGAVKYAMAHTDQDICHNYKANRVDNIDGFTITVS